MGNKQSYDLTQAQARQNQNHPSEEVVSQQDEFCRPVSLASTSSMRKPSAKQRRENRDNKENESLSSDGNSPVQMPRENAVDVPAEPREPFIGQKREYAEPHRLYDTPPMEDVILVRAVELEKSDVTVQQERKEHEITQMKEKNDTLEREKARKVAEEAVLEQIKRNSRDHGRSPISRVSSIAEEVPPPSQEKLFKAREVEAIPLELGGRHRVEEEEIEEATRQLDNAISSAENTMIQEESNVVLEESAVEEFATVSLALDEDISAVETTRITIELQKLHYTHPLTPLPLEAAPSQNSYIKLK